MERSILRLLSESGVAFEVLEHAPAGSSREAALARGLPQSMGAKSLVVKTDEAFCLFVLSGATSLSSRLIRRRLGVSRIRFASRRELLQRTGLEPGSVPPFGRPILPLDLFADPRLLDQERLAFSPGVRRRSIVLDSADWRSLAQPEVFRFSR